MDGESWRGKEVVVDSHAVGAAVVDSHAVGAAEPLATRTHAFHLILFPPLTPSSPPPPCTGHQQRPSLGAPFNAHSPLDSHVPGGLPALKARWQALLHQVRVCDSSNYLKAFQIRVCDSSNYLKAFQASDVLVVVGWSSDLLPFARRNNNITVAAPADGTLLFADLWAVPATARYNIPKAAWRNRGPSPLIGQWMKFCLQPARAVPLEREIFSAFSPTVLPDCLPLAPMLPADDSSINAASTSGSSTKGSTSRATNTSNSNTSSSSSTTTTTATASSSSSSSSARGLPAAGILAASEFVEPLDGATQAELNQVLLGDTKGGVAAQGQTMQGRVKQAIEAVGSALDKLRKRG
ncbi:unnamed protein product [Closterium sp. NIES-64]|nr:unnamed protein product [Closterium sp. NIES-64]